MTSLLAVHGFAGGPGSFDDVGLPLRALTLPGHDGRDAVSFDDAVAEVVATVDEETVQWGYSLGARIALAAALRCPPRALILESGRGSVDDAARAAVDDARADALEDDAAAFFAAWDDGPLFRHLNEAQRRRRQALRARHDRHQLAAALRAFSPGRQRPFSVARLRIPVLLIAGADDAVYVDHAEHLTRNLPACRLSIVSGCGHQPHLERPAVVARLIRDFVDSLSAQPLELRP